MATIIDGKARWKTDLAGYYAGEMSRLAQITGAKVRPPSAVDGKSAPLKAYINWGRLIVDCPDCGGAEYVWLQGPHIMQCAQCWNATTRGLWRLVELPPDIHEIVEVLATRLVKNQNWTPGETIEMLRAENKAHERGG